MNSTRNLLASALLAGLLPAASALTLQGQVTAPAPDLSIGIWAVSRAGQAGQALTSAPVDAAGRWNLTLEGAPAAALPLTPEPGWPGLLPPVTMTGTPRTQEARAYAFTDRNRDGQPDPGEPLCEVSLRAGERPLFLVWTESPVTVTGGRGYRVQLQSGWNAWTLGLGQGITLDPYKGSPLQTRISP